MLSYGLPNQFPQKDSDPDRSRSSCAPDPGVERVGAGHRRIEAPAPNVRNVKLNPTGTYHPASQPPPTQFAAALGQVISGHHLRRRPLGNRGGEQPRRRAVRATGLQPRQIALCLGQRALFGQRRAPSPAIATTFWSTASTAR